MASAVLYGADWCAVCHKAKAHLISRGVEVTVKEVSYSDRTTPEQAGHNRAEMTIRLTFSERGGNAMEDVIPVIDFGGTDVFQGFSAGKIDAFLGEGGDPDEAPSGVPNKRPDPGILDSFGSAPASDFFAGLGLGGMGAGLMVLAVLWALSKKR